VAPRPHLSPALRAALADAGIPADGAAAVTAPQFVALAKAATKDMSPASVLVSAEQHFMLTPLPPPVKALLAECFARTAAHASPSRPSFSPRSLWEALDSIGLPLSMAEARRIIADAAEAAEARRRAGAPGAPAASSLPRPSTAAPGAATSSSKGWFGWGSSSSDATTTSLSAKPEIVAASAAPGEPGAVSDSQPVVELSGDEFIAALALAASHAKLLDHADALERYLETYYVLHLTDAKQHALTAAQQQHHR
jgi:hypothetical protein